MEQDLAVQHFDYSLMDCSEIDIEFLKSKEQSIKSRTAQTVIENGRDLLEAKERVGHGNFQEWVKGAFPWSYKIASKMMNVAKNFKNEDSSLLTSFQKEALYALAAPSVPDAAREEATVKAEAGETVTHADAQELIEAHKLIEEHEQRIQGYEEQIRQLKSQLPTQDILQRISELQQQLLAEKDLDETIFIDMI